MQFEFYILTFIISAFFSLLFTPIVGSFAIKYGALDQPSGRKVHRKPIPLWGGVGVFIAVFGTIFIMGRVNSDFSRLLAKDSEYLKHIFEGIFVSSIVVTVLGIVDDLKGVIPTTKLLGQIIAAMIIMQYGLKISGLGIPFTAIYIRLPLYVSIALTVVWLVGFMNSINLIDGVDGLATGVMAIASFIFFVITLLQIRVQTDPAAIDMLKFASVLSLVLCGSSLGFLKYNFPPGKIFLGDSGSLLLGFLAGIITITGILKTAAALTLIIPIIIFGVPIGDAFFSLVRRIFRHKSFMKADKDHIHHRLLYRKGWNAKKVDIRIYAITFALGLLAVIMTIL
ncbi:MAG: MraY family glycosyltransferase [Elusimicrobia bacterium]|jgi:UDP-GlcNAc:undecaprenyl-phosphate GlcNAc-1-phosphate transferase|nr:MraY family glycosyltransferase [Elusimicrobiota bacterium]